MQTNPTIFLLIDYSGDVIRVLSTQEKVNKALEDDINNEIYSVEEFFIDSETPYHYVM